jgi:hypothetical protein
MVTGSFREIDGSLSASGAEAIPLRLEAQPAIPFSVLATLRPISGTP